ncbi:hypothetical protein [Sphingomonas sp. VNH70]|uniref:hypothetical protein n=1 Tax=Sphingomonas silueang TaxID=3156617 RepID=UPI0032B551F7
MFDRTAYATHPDMTACVSNDELRERYLPADLFREGAALGHALPGDASLFRRAGLAPHRGGCRHVRR